MSAPSLYLHNFEIGKKHEVYVTHINNPHSFYVRTTSIEDATMASLQRIGRLITTEEIRLGKTVVYYSDLLQKHVRGDITYIENNKSKILCDVFARDYGCLDKSVNLEHIYTISEDQSKVPSLALHCQLENCEPIGKEFKQDVTDTMKFYLSAETSTITVNGKIDNKLIVKLTNVDCPGDVSTILALINCTVIGCCPRTIHTSYNASSSKIQQLSNSLTYKFKDLKIGDSLHVRIQSYESLNSFYVAEVSDYKKYINQRDDFTFYCKNRPESDTWVPGTCCGVITHFSRIQYERGIVRKITKPNEKALVYLIDWGKEAEVFLSQIKSVTSNMFYVEPGIAIHCSTEADQLWETGMGTVFYPGYQLKIKVVEIGDGLSKPYKVNLSKTEII